MGVEDRCILNSHPSSCYTVNDAYKNLSEVDDNNNQTNSQILWLKIVPLKISIFIWRLFLNRNPTKDNFGRWGFLRSKMCGKLWRGEGKDHLFIKYDFFSLGWVYYFKFIGFLNDISRIIIGSSLTVWWTR